MTSQPSRDRGKGKQVVLALEAKVNMTEAKINIQSSVKGIHSRREFVCCVCVHLHTCVYLLVSGAEEASTRTIKIAHRLFHMCLCAALVFAPPVQCHFHEALTRSQADADVMLLHLKNC
jgi:hypothetical protein